MFNYKNFSKSVLQLSNLNALRVILFTGLAAATLFAEAYTKEYRYSDNGKLLAEIAPLSTFGTTTTRSAKRYLYELSSRPTLVTAVEYGTIQDSDLNVDPSQWATFQVESTTRTSYNDFGQKTFSGVVSDGEYISLKQYNYDARNRMLCEAVRMNASLLGPEYSPQDACSLGTEGSDGEDRITKYTYDDIDNVETITKALGTDIEQVYATYTYSGYQKTSVTDAKGNYSEFSYDIWGRLEYFYYPSKEYVGYKDNNDYEQYAYDANGNRTMWRKRSGDTFYFTYDAKNRVDLKNVPATTTHDVLYGYELTGANTTVKFSNGQGITNQFSGFGEILESTTAINGSSRKVQYTYDKHGNKTRLTHADQVTVDYMYDQLDRAYRILVSGSTVLWMNYNGFGQLDSIDRNYEKNGATTDLSWLAGRLQGKSENLAGTTADLAIELGYNPANQITSQYLSNDQYHYIGNDYRTGEYLVNGKNQIENVAGTDIDHDLNGNLSKDGNKNYVFDKENRLTNVNSPGVNATLTYDPMGRLFEVYNSASGTRTQFLYDGDAMIAEYTSSTSTSPSFRYVHGIGADVPLLQFAGSSISSANRRYLHTNHQGSVIAGSEYLGSVMWTNTYDAYGIPGLENEGRFAYTGQMWLPELDLYHYKARIYDPWLGRFLQTDPVGYEDQMNLYAYVGNDPLNFVDPKGEKKYALGISTELVIKYGFKLEASVSFDTETLEIGSKGVVGGRFGFAAGAGIIANVEASGESAKDSIAVTVVGNAEANLGPVSISKSLIEGSISSDEGVVATRDGNDSAQASVAVGDMKLKPQLKLGATTGLDVEVETTSTIVRDTVDKVKEIFD